MANAGGKQLKDFDAAGTISDSDLIFAAQGGLEKKMTAAQLKAYLAANAGVSVASSATTYQTSSSGTTVPTGTWTAAVPAVSKGQYLWSRVILTMTDASTVTSYSVAYQGADGNPGSSGVGVASAAVTYQTSASGTTVPTGTWSGSVPALTQGQFLWTRTVTTYTDASTSTAYSVAYQGADAVTSNIWFKQTGVSVAHNAGEGLSTTFSLLSLVIPANTMGPQGLLEFLPALTMTDTSNAKTITIAIGGVTLWLYSNGSGSTSFDSYIQIQNANSQTANMVRASNNNAPFQTGIIGMQQTAIDFTQDQTLTVTCSFAAGSTANTVTLNHWHVRVWNQ
ncbi:hypothetical protein [Caballeronia sp. AZ10_KS36]|uniref:hypothetical protein n=1 Tax=Caballeronia sp. AZ10_KS36 TaxID=2921757 RepID=UPI00202919A5|nr:hypothetical protein [Caballeronia sp. AZ10_KS36]